MNGSRSNLKSRFSVLWIMLQKLTLRFLDVQTDFQSSDLRDFRFKNSDTRDLGFLEISDNSYLN